MRSNPARAVNAAPWGAAAALAALAAYSVMAITHGGVLPRLTTPTLGSSDVGSIEVRTSTNPSSGQATSAPPVVPTSAPVGGSAPVEAGESFAARPLDERAVGGTVTPSPVESPPATEQRKPTHAPDKGKKARDKEKRARVGHDSSKGLGAENGRARGRRQANAHADVLRGSSSKTTGNARAKPARAKGPRSSRLL